MSTTQRTLVFVKPEAVKRGLTDEVVRRIEGIGLRIIALKKVKLSKDKAAELYGVHSEKPFYEDLVGYASSAPIVAMVVEGDNAIASVRKLIGRTNPKEAEPGSIRHDFGLDVMRNAVHASDSPESARREIPVIFESSEIG